MNERRPGALRAFDSSLLRRQNLFAETIGFLKQRHAGK
ncbi:hypothetical protein FHX15_003045 [Rhizobium sp. BK650]|nr:hypothetical protein [Rhizobium sp. BK650]